MQFGTKRLKFLYFAIKLAVIAVIGAAMSYCAHLVFWRMLGGQASIGVMSAFVGGVCGAVLLAAAVFAILWGVERKKDLPKPSIAEAEALFCVKTCVPLAAGRGRRDRQRGRRRRRIVSAIDIDDRDRRPIPRADRQDDFDRDDVGVARARGAARGRVVVGQAKRVKQPPLDADALVRKLAEYRALNPKPPKGKKGGDGQPAPDKPRDTSRQRGEEVPSDEPRATAMKTAKTAFEISLNFCLTNNIFVSIMVVA